MPPPLLQIGERVDDGTKRAPLFYVTRDVGAALASATNASASIVVDESDVVYAQYVNGLSLVTLAVSIVVGSAAVAAFLFALRHPGASVRTRLSIFVAVVQETCQGISYFLDPWYARATLSRTAFDIVYGVSVSLATMSVVFFLLVWSDFLLATEMPPVRRRWRRVVHALCAFMLTALAVTAVIRVISVAAGESEEGPWIIFVLSTAAQSLVCFFMMIIVVWRFRGRLLGQVDVAPASNDLAQNRHAHTRSLLMLASKYLLAVFFSVSIVVVHLVLFSFFPKLYGEYSHGVYETIWRFGSTSLDVFSIIFWTTLIVRKGGNGVGSRSGTSRSRGGTASTAASAAQNDSIDSSFYVAAALSSSANDGVDSPVTVTELDSDASKSMAEA